MNSAQGYRKFVAHLESHRARLSELEMVCVGGVSPTNQTWLGGHEFEVDFVAQSSRLAEGKLAFVDLGGSSVGLRIQRSRLAVIDSCSRRDRRGSRRNAGSIDLSGTTPRPLNG